MGARRTKYRRNRAIINLAEIVEEKQEEKSYMDKWVEMTQKEK